MCTQKTHAKDEQMGGPLLEGARGRLLLRTACFYARQSRNAAEAAGDMSVFLPGRLCLANRGFPSMALCVSSLAPK
jgi:hypothetical protein